MSKRRSNSVERRNDAIGVASATGAMARGAAAGVDVAVPEMPMDDPAKLSPPKGGMDMYGISGLARYGQNSRIYEEFAKELQGPQGMKNYREMMDNDPIIGAILFAAQHLCRKVSFGFKPANDTNEAKAVADFVGGAIFDDLDNTWPDVVSEILTMLPFGWALLEFDMKRRLGLGEQSLMPDPTTAQGQAPKKDLRKWRPSRFEDGKIGFHSWSLRSQETLFQWEFDEDSNAVCMEQMAPPDFRLRRIPLAKGLLFRTQVSKNNPEGRSMLRNAWTSYYLKKNLQIFEGIGIERDLAGYPLIQIEKPDIANGLMPPDVWNEKDPTAVATLAMLQRIVRSVRVDEQMGLVMPWWAKFELVNGGSRRRVDTNAIIARYDQRIAQSMMADFIMLGHEAVGSKALAATKISLFTAALSSFLDTAGAIIDRQATPMLLRFNGIPLELAPIFWHGDVESVNIQELGDFIQKIAGTGFNPLKGMDAQKAVMEAARMPTTDVDGTLDPVDTGNKVGDANSTDRGGPSGDKPGDSKGRSGSGPVAPQESTTGLPDALGES